MKKNNRNKSVTSTDVRPKAAPGESVNINGQTITNIDSPKENANAIALADNMDKHGLSEAGISEVPDQNINIKGDNKMEDKEKIVKEEETTEESNTGTIVLSVAAGAALGAIGMNYFMNRNSGSTEAAGDLVSAAFDLF